MSTGAASCPSWPASTCTATTTPGGFGGLREKDGKAIVSGELIDRSPKAVLHIASFGEDRRGELLILAFDGRIHLAGPTALMRIPIVAVRPSGESSLSSVGNSPVLPMS